MGETATVGARARLVRVESGKTQVEMAKHLGVATATWQKIERDEGLPSGETLMQFEKLGINPGWVLTGMGPMRTEQLEQRAPVQSVDPLLMEKLYKAVERAYRDAGQRPPGHRIANEAAELFNTLQARVADVRDDLVVDAVIPALAQTLIERLAEAAARPGTGKRSA